MSEAFDLDSVTLDEMIEVEVASERPFLVLVRSRTGLLTVVLFLKAYRERASEQGWDSRKRWSELVSTRLSESYRLRSASQPDSPAQSSEPIPLGS